MKTADAIQLAAAEKGLSSTAQKPLADLLECTPSAICQWGEEVPRARVWQLRVLRPQWFELEQVGEREKRAA